MTDYIENEHGVFYRIEKFNPGYFVWARDEENPTGLKDYCVACNTEEDAVTAASNLTIEFMRRMPNIPSGAFAVLTESLFRKKC